MKWLRGGGVLLVFGLALWAIDRLCVLPWRCNNVIRQVNNATVAMFERSDSLVVKVRTRSNITRLVQCLDCPSSARVDVLMGLAAAYRILNEPRSAIDAYRAALRLDCRPELYLNVATVEYEVGDRKAAIRHFAMSMALASFLIDYAPGAPAYLTEQHLPTDIERQVDDTIPQAKQWLINQQRF